MARSKHLGASAGLASLDPVMAGLVERHGPMRLPPAPPVAKRFEKLAEAIVHQQLAGKAAIAIWTRLRSLYPEGPLDAADVLATSETDLRGAGLSGSKAAAIHDLALHVDDGRVELHRMGRMPEEDVVGELVQVRGIGPWTAQMFLIFTLHRLDVWPTGDYGVRSGYGIAYGMSEAPDAKALEALGDPFRPYRSVAAWYCWRATDTKLT
jgi:DNA-3-methyladenine glycosylase II